MRTEIIEEYEEFTIWADYKAHVHTTYGESNDQMRREVDTHVYESLYMFGYSIPCTWDESMWILRNKYPTYEKITKGFFNSQEAAETAADEALDEVMAAIAEAKATLKAEREAELAKEFYVVLQPGGKRYSETFISYGGGDLWICGRKVWRDQEMFAFGRRFHSEGEWSKLYYDGKEVATGDRQEIDRVVALIEEKIGKIEIKELK